MSAFLTELPVDINGAKVLLPKGSFVESVTWNAENQTVEMVWSNRDLKTPYTTPTKFPLQMLHDQQIPDGATLKPVVVKVVTSNNSTVDSKPRKGVKVKRE